MDPSFHGNEKIPHSDDPAMIEPSSVLHEKERQHHSQHHSHKSPYDQERPMKDTPFDDFTKPSPSQRADKEFVDDQILSKPEQQRMNFDSFTLEDITSFKAQAVSPQATPPGQQTHDKKDPKATTTSTSTKKTSTTKDPSKPTNNLPSLDDKDKSRQLPPNTRAPPPAATNTDNVNVATTSFISLPPGSDLGKIGQLGQIGVFSGSSPSHYSPNQFLLMLCLGFFIMKMFLFNNNNNTGSR
ncbi:hypothetical protein INT45_001517 [Circinella minor]|uniref:Uncharacterized protein n=1 Tax=Circinella minor TaxID=1195481 RepID=A0A8H7VQQ8_9FUNG|nr:hypothetical protein INT45_001517 [Circinella minor]